MAAVRLDAVHEVLHDALRHLRWVGEIDMSADVLNPIKLRMTVTFKIALRCLDASNNISDNQIENINHSRPALPRCTAECCPGKSRGPFLLPTTARKCSLVSMKKVTQQQLRQNYCCV